jgi:hypothetical protein
MALWKGMSKRRRLRRFLAVLILPLILLAVGWTAIWYVMAGRVAAHVLAWEQQQRAQGWTIIHGPPRRGGWPMAAGVTLPRIAISGGAQYLPSGLVWQAGALTVALDIRHLGALYWGVTGRQSLGFGKAPAIPFQATTFAGQVKLSPAARPPLFQLHAAGLIAAIMAADGTRQPLSIATLDAAEAADGTADVTGNALVLAATMTGVGLPPHLLPALGQHLLSLSFDMALSGPVPTEGPAPQPAALATAWRNAGGSLALRAFHLEDGPLTVNGQGRFQLDAFLRPEGTAALHLGGLDETMDRLAENGTLTPLEARAIRAMLGLMMRPPGADALDAPVSLRDGLISLGAIPLLRLPL